jgi:hypothetical protein
MVQRAENRAPRQTARPLVKVIASSLTLLIIVGIVEAGGMVLGIPVFGPRYCPGERESEQRDNFVADEITGWQMRPLYEFGFETEGRMIRYRSDANGWRTDPSEVALTARPHRVVVVGDSYAWGYGVEYPESVTAQLTTMHPAVSAKSVGMPGYGVDQIWLATRHDAIPLDPDLVVVTLYPDDFERSFNAFRPAEGFTKPSFRLSDGGLVERKVGDCESWLTRFLAENSRLFALYRRISIRLARSFGLGSWFELNAAFLDEIRADCARADVPVVFVHIPYFSWKPFPALKHYMERTDARFIDLLDELGNDRSRYYFLDDGHLNPEGHHRLAELLSALLLNEFKHSELQRSGGE